MSNIECHPIGQTTLLVLLTFLCDFGFVTSYYYIIICMDIENNLGLFSCARALCKKCNADEKTKSKIIIALFTDCY